MVSCPISPLPVHIAWLIVFFLQLSVHFRCRARAQAALLLAEAKSHAAGTRPLVMEMKARANTFLRSRPASQPRIQATVLASSTAWMCPVLAWF